MPLCGSDHIMDVKDEIVRLKAGQRALQEKMEVNTYTVDVHRTMLCDLLCACYGSDKHYFDCESSAQAPERINHTPFVFHESRLDNILRMYKSLEERFNSYDDGERGQDKERVHDFRKEYAQIALSVGQQRAQLEGILEECADIRQSLLQREQGGETEDEDECVQSISTSQGLPACVSGGRGSELSKLSTAWALHKAGPTCPPHSVGRGRYDLLHHNR